MSRTEGYTEEGYPVLAIEYGHAMGNSPGALADYWDYNYSHDKMCGGFAWEFRSHGFGAHDADGKVFMKYGDDFRDEYHWSNFNMDGYCLSDGRPKPSWFELGTVSFAAYTTFDGKTITIKNTNDFLSLSYLTAVYEIECDGESVKKSALPLPAVLPHESYSFEPDVNVDKTIAGARYYLSILYYHNGEEVHKKQFPLGVLSAAEPYVPSTKRAITSTQNGILRVAYDDFCCEFNKGMLSAIRKGGKTLLDAPMRLNLHRAYIDNDGIENFDLRRIGEWRKALLRHYNFNPIKIDAEELDDRVVVTSVGAYTANSLYAGFMMSISYEVYSDGTILVTISGDPYGNLPGVLPRIGVVFEMPSAYNIVKWLGRGPRESYPDSLANAPVGIYSGTIDALNVDYDYPQETGNHESTYALTLLKNNSSLLSFVGSDTFAFSYHDFTLENLTGARHKNEIQKSEKNYLCIDYKMRGLGSHSCGPEPEEKYELHPHKFVFSFAIQSGDFDCALSLSRKDFKYKTRALSSAYIYEKPQKLAQIADCEMYIQI